MINFKLWLEQDETTHFTYPDNIQPKNMIGSGYFARVYDTNHPNVVMRVEEMNDSLRLKKHERGQPCEKFMMRPEIQATKGVAKIYNNQIRELDLNGKQKPIFITYKEKLNTDYEDYFIRKYGPEKTNELLSTILKQTSIENEDEDEIIRNLREFSPETDNLIKAIRLGLPIYDLHKENVALDKENNLVAIDC